jgi:hypothetical protein
MMLKVGDSVTVNCIEGFGGNGSIIETRDGDGVKLAPYRVHLENSPQPSEETKFHALATAWRWHNRGKSVLDYDDFSYLQIIGMGPPVVPYLLKAVEDGEGFWYFALKCITGREAETPDMHGDPEAIRQAWIEWGKKYGQLAIRG